MGTGSSNGTQQPVSMDASMFTAPRGLNEQPGIGGGGVGNAVQRIMALRGGGIVDPLMGVPDGTGGQMLPPAGKPDPLLQHTTNLRPGGVPPQAPYRSPIQAAFPFRPWAGWGR